MTAEQGKTVSSTEELNATIARLEHDLARSRSGAAVVHVPSPQERVAMARRYELDWTPAQVEVIKSQYIKDATDDEFAALMMVAKIKGLDPLKKQIYFRKQSEWDAETEGYVKRWIYITAIGGFRTLAERTGLYDGQSEPEWIYEVNEETGHKRLVACRVIVYRKGMGHPPPAYVHLIEFQQLKRDKTPNQMWTKMPHSQLAKCAEALAFRKTFPDDCGDMYIAEELPDEDEQAVTQAQRMSSTPARETASPKEEAQPSGGGEATSDKVAHWVGRFEKAGSLAKFNEEAMEASEKAAFTAAERKKIAQAFTTWKEHYEKLEPKPAPPEAEQKKEGGDNREPGQEG